MGHSTPSPTSYVLILFYICCIHLLFAQGAYSNYSFTLYTRNLYPNNNDTSTQDLEYKIGHSFVVTLSASFNLNPHDFTLYISPTATNTTNNASSSPSNHSESSIYAVSITHLSESTTYLLFESNIAITSWKFEEYILYKFLERALSHTLNTSSSLILTNLSCIQVTSEYERCPSTNQTHSNSDWKDVTNELFQDIYNFLRWIFSGVLGIASLFVMTAYIHSWIVWNEDIYIGNAIFFCFATFDWYSDILFTFSIPVEYIWLWLISFCLLLIPLIGNVVWLVSQQKLWEQDAAMGARVKAWLIRWRPFLYSMTIISGSAFGSINICNSNMWGYPLFRMGLRNMHLERFDSKRLFITVLGENIPQLILQGFYWFLWNKNFLSSDFNENRLILTLAMISGIISILYAFGVIYSSKATLSRFNDNEEELFEFNIISSTDWPTKDKRKNRAYKYKLYPLRKAFASLLQIDVAYVELHPPVKIEYGYQLRFTLMVKDMGGNQAALQTLKDLIEYKELGEKIQDVWELQTLPRIEELKWKKDRKRDYQKNMVLLQHSVVNNAEPAPVQMKPLKKGSASVQSLSRSMHVIAPDSSSLSIAPSSSVKNKSYFQAPPDPAAPKLAEAAISDYSGAAQSNKSLMSPHAHSHTQMTQLAQWNAMSSISFSGVRGGGGGGHMHSQSVAQLQLHHSKSQPMERDSLYHIVTAPPKVVRVNENNNNNNNEEEKVVAPPENNAPPPPPVDHMRVGGADNKAVRSSIASVGSVGSEAAFQQQLFNHIRQKNNMSTFL